MNTLIRVPKKLEAGMKVVFKLDMGANVAYRDFETVPTGKWLKGELRTTEEHFEFSGSITAYALFYKNYPIYADKSKCIIIRSVSYADNVKYDKAERNKVAKLKYKEKKRAEQRAKSIKAIDEGRALFEIPNRFEPQNHKLAKQVKWD